MPGIPGDARATDWPVLVPAAWSLRVHCFISWPRELWISLVIEDQAPQAPSHRPLVACCASLSPFRPAPDLAPTRITRPFKTASPAWSFGSGQGTSSGEQGGMVMMGSQQPGPTAVPRPTPSTAYTYSGVHIAPDLPLANLHLHCPAHARPHASQPACAHPPSAVQPPATYLTHRQPPLSATYYPDLQNRRCATTAHLPCA